MDREKFEELCECVGDETIDSWYQKSEPIFQSQGITSEKDFVKLVAFAYSWMPTIPEWRCELNWPECEKALDKLKGGDDGALKQVLELVVPSINNSIVGASKVLYFAFPQRVPIIDSNVIIGWRSLFFPKGIRGKKKNGVLATLPSNFGAYGSDTEMRSRHIDLYIRYAENMFAWEKALGDVTVRDIEAKLYLLGKQISDEVKKANKAV